MKAPQQQPNKKQMMRPKDPRTGQKENKAWGEIKKCYDSDRAFFKVKNQHFNELGN